MKTFTQFNEDISRLEQRRQQLRQKQKDQITKQKERVAAYQTAQQKKIEAQREREQLKKEIKRELQTEQSPTMKQTDFNKMKAREQAKGGIRHRVHVHQEIGAEARAQEAAHQRRLNKLTGTP